KLVSLPYLPPPPPLPSRPPLLVCVAFNAAGPLKHSPTLVPRQRVARVAGTRCAAHGRGGGGARGARGAVREPRVRPDRRRAWASRPVASHALRRRSPLAAGFRHGVVRGARPLLVPLHAGAQRPAPGA